MTFTWSVGNPVQVPALNNVDIRPAYVTNGADFFLFYADGSNRVKRWLCNSLDDMTPLPDGVLDGSFVKQYGDDRFWIGGAVLVNNIMYAVVHAEFRYSSTIAPNFNWFRRLGLAKSTDQGATWHYLGDIITSDFSTDINDFAGAREFQAGPGDPSIFADWSYGYVYVSYTTFWADKVTGARTEQTCIARCPFSSLPDVTMWRKWDYVGWTQPGRGGHNEAIFAGQDNVSISWSNYLNAYIAIGHSTSNVSFISSASDLSKQDWHGTQMFGFDQDLMWYNWLVDPNGDPFHLRGQTFRLYAAQNNFAGIPTQYVPVTLQLT